MNRPHIRPSSRGVTIGFGRGAPFLFLAAGTTLEEAWERFLQARQIAWAFALNGYEARA